MRKPHRRGSGKSPGIVFEDEAKVRDAAGRDIKKSAGRDYVDGDQVTNNYYDARKPKKKKIPILLFYKMNRKEQKAEFDKLFDQYRADAPRPIIAIIHGDEDQAMDKFLERIREDFIPTRLPKSSRERAQHRYIRIRDLSQTIFNDMQEFQDQLRELLAKQVDNDNTTADLDKIQKRLAQGKCPVIVELQLTEDLILHSKINTLSGILDFWSQLRLSKGQFLFIAVYCIYEKRSATGWASKLGALFRMDPKAEIRSRLETLRFNHDGGESIIAGVFPELFSIPEHETRAWAEAFHDEYRILNIEDFKETIRNMYADERPKPMQLIAKTLKEQYLKMVPEQEEFT